MQHHQSSTDSNDDLHTLEPLRIILAVGALRLGLLPGIDRADGNGGYQNLSFLFQPVCREKHGGVGAEGIVPDASQQEPTPRRNRSDFSFLNRQRTGLTVGAVAHHPPGGSTAA